MSKDQLRKTIMGRIETLAASETTVKEQLDLAAREILEHYSEHSDGTLVTRLLAALTPLNRKRAQEFFDTFVLVTETGAKSGSKSKREKVDAARAEWLGGTQSFWEWAVAEVDTAPKDADLKADLVKALKRAMHGIHTSKRDQEGLKKSEIAVAIMGEISLTELMASLEMPEDTSEQEAAPLAVAA